MANTFVKNIFDKTNGGADIIIGYYPQAASCLGTKKKFSIRCESDPSTSWYKFPDCDKWAITDWGDSAKPKDAIAITMEQENLDWYGAIYFLADRYGISTGKGREQQIITIEKLTGSDIVGAFSFESLSMDKHDLRYWGRCVKDEDLSALGWTKVSHLRKVYADKVVIKSSTPDYPIFIRKCPYIDEAGEVKCFYKIYEPMNRDKGYRFRYEGEKMPNYVNGLYEATLAHEQEQQQSVSRDKQKPVVICCGERDAAVTHAFGCKPIWYNSESAFPTRQKDIDELRKLGPDLYFIPDIDATGVKKGKELALRFPELKTVWLPFSLKEQKDWRGNPKKDLCDWASIEDNNRYAFCRMLQAAQTADYFMQTEKTTFINDSALHYYLWLNDWGSFCFHNGKDLRLGFACRQGCMVKEVSQTSVVQKFLLEQLPRDSSHSYKYNLLCKNRSYKLSLEALAAAPFLPYTLTKPTRDCEYVFFENCVVKVTASSMECIPAANFEGVAMESDVVKHSFKMPDHMPFDLREDDLERPVESILNTDSYLLRMVINMSKIYWSDEYVSSGLSADEYYRKYSAMIVSDVLDQDKQCLQFECFLNFCYNIGSIISRHKKRTERTAPYFVDKEGDNQSSNGRTGKGTVFDLIGEMAPMLFFDGRSRQLAEYNHAFDRVTHDTRRIRVEDFNPTINSFDTFYNMISDTMVINPKHGKQFELSYDESPKVFFTSNFFLQDSDASTRGRINYTLIGSWYHKATASNGFLYDHVPYDDFGIELGAGYTEMDWNNDFAFLLCCLRLYMIMSAHNTRLEVPAELLDYKRAQSGYTSEFDEWISGYISGKLGTDIVRQVMMGDYCESTRSKISSREFGKCVRNWAKANRYELNKGKTLDANGRYMKYNQGFGNSVEHYGFTKVE